jgi:serine/threonine-protein kinase RsbW
MAARNRKPIMGRVRREMFVGRTAELDRLYLLGLSGDESRARLVTGDAGVGVSETLRQLYDRMFADQSFVVPFYFAVEAADRDSRGAATRYLYQFLLQTIAFRRRNPSLLASKPDICELAKLAPLQDVEWVNRLCEVCGIDSPLNDDRAFVRTALTAPFRTGDANRLKICIILDDLHNAGRLMDGEDLLSEISSITERSGSRLIIGARKGTLPSSGLNIEIPKLDRRSVGEISRKFCDETDIAISDESADLIALQLGGNINLLNLFLNAAASKAVSLSSFRDVQRLYTDELIKGSIGEYYDGLLSRSLSQSGSLQKFYDEFFLLMSTGNEAFQVTALMDRLEVSNEEARSLTTVLRSENLIEVESGYGRVADNIVFRDLVAARHRSTAKIISPAVAAAFTVTNALKRSPVIMSREYRRNASAGLQELLTSFDLQSVPKAMLDYRLFRDELKGLSNDEVRTRFDDQPAEFTLPQIAVAAPVVEFMPEFGSEPESERAILGVGFTDRGYRNENETAWFAVEIDSKLEADAAVAQQMCDRIESVAAELGYSNYKIWLVAPEGFSDGALSLLAERRGIGSSRRQVELLKSFVSGGTESEGSATEYEIVIPIGDETEIIAAHAFEEIARRIDLPAKTINQIKTALIEACINAAEHSLSPDRKIRQKFTIDDKKIVITISNRGLRLTDRIAEQPSVTTDEGRRGWGLGLIRQLMDEVRVESVEDGTRIVMTKYR